MDTKKVSALLTAIEKGSLTSAAAELGYSQSGLTHMMNSLEDELGISLLVRNKNGVRLSAAGQDLFPYMQALVKSAGALEENAERLREQNSSILRVGAYSSVMQQWIPAILSAFRQISPDTDVTIEVGGVVDTYEKLKDDQLDCAFVSFNDALCQGLTYIPLRDDPLVAILPGDTQMDTSSFPVQQFSGQEFLMPSDGFDLDINHIFNQWREKVTPRIRYTNLADAALVSMVGHGLGVSILSELVMQNIPGNVLIKPLDPPAFRHLGIAICERWRSDKTIRRFIKCAQTVIVQMYEADGDK